MKHQSDQHLLREYAQSHAEAAFAELVRRHIDLIHSAAFRMTGQAHSAQDVTQAVFITLAQNAARLVHHPVLTGWLHTTARNLAAKHVRAAVRRQHHEEEAAAMNEFRSTPDVPWEDIAPHVDAALGELGEADRDAVLLRFFENKSVAEIATALQTTEAAAQKRVYRALEKLRGMFQRRGVTLTTTLVASTISANAVQAAPIGLAITISAAAALAGTTLATTATITATKAIAMTTLQKTIIGAALAVAVGTGIYEARQAARLRSEIRTLQQNQTANTEEIEQLRRERNEAASQLELLATKPVPHLPAPPVQASGTPLPPENLATKIQRGDETPRLTAEQTSRYLEANRRNATSLLAAYRTSGNAALLQEAMEKYPNDPQVAYEALFKADVSPAERRRWLETLKQNAPENALANYMSASEYFKSGQTDQAVQELIAASSKQGFQDFTVDRWHADEEAYRAAGYSEADTKMAATWGLTLPQLQELKQVGLSVVDLATAYRNAGDAASAQAALEMAIRLGQQFDGSTGTAGVPLVTQLVGMALQQMALKAMDPTSAYGAGTVGQQLEHLAQQRQEISNLVKQSEPLHNQMTPQDWINYNDRMRIFGEQNAIRWLLNKYGQD